MPEIPISPNVALAEANAEIAWLRNRSLIQAQAIADLTARNETLAAEIADLKQEADNG